jgi:hypothetical protein
MECGHVFTGRPHFGVCGAQPGVFTVVDRSDRSRSSVSAFKDALTMKQSAAKTLGVAALGAAFAAVGAGAANAAPAVPDATQATQALDGVTKTLPGAGQALAQGKGAVGAGVAAAQPAVQNALAKSPAAPGAQLLGGLPVQGTGRPGHGVAVNGLPLR